MYSYVFLVLPMCISAFFVAYILINFKTENKAQLSIIWAFGAAFLIFLGKSSVNELFFSPAIDVLYIMGLMFVYPAGYRTIVLMCRRKTDWWQKILIFLPAAVFGVLLTIGYLSMNTAEIESTVIHYRSEFDMSNAELPALRNIDRIHDMALIVYVLELIYVLVLGLREIVGFDKKLYHLYSNFKGHSLKEIGRWLAIAIVTSIVTSVIDSMFFGNRIENSWTVALPALIIAVALVLFGVTVLRQKNSADEQQQMLDRCRLNADDNAAESNRAKIRSELADMMLKEQLYLNPDLEISDVAWRLKVSCGWLADFIEHTHGLTFYAFVNRYRVRRAILLLAAPTDKDQKTVIDEAWRGAGFSSRRMMASVFKEFRIASPL